MRNFKKKFTQVFQRPYSFNTKPIFKTWVWFYSLELEEFKNVYMVSVFQCFREIRAFVCAWLKIANFRRFKKRKQLHTTVCRYVY